MCCEYFLVFLHLKKDFRLKKVFVGYANIMSFGPAAS